MRIISFAWTRPALLAGRKTVTRREWDDSYASRFGEGELVAVYDRSPRYGGKQVATIQLTRVPYRESTRDAPDSDYEAEGFAYLDSIGAKVDERLPVIMGGLKLKAHAAEVTAIAWEDSKGPRTPAMLRALLTSLSE